MGLLAKSLSANWELNGRGPEDDFWYMPIGMKTVAGKEVTEHQAFNYLTVYACVSLIASDIARLPFHVYQKNGNERIRIYDHPLSEVNSVKANDETSALVHRQTGMGHLLLWGNKYDLKEFDRIGRARQLWQFPAPGNMSVRRAKKDMKGGIRQGELYYAYQDRGQEEYFPALKIFHVPAFGFNGLVGKSPISFARENIGLALAMEEYGARYFADGTHPSAAISMPPEAGGMSTEDSKKYAAFMKEQYAGLGRAHTLMVLPNGEKFEPISIPARDAQFIESRRFQKLEICGMYHVPPSKVAIHEGNVSYNSLESENQSYVDGCLIHWTTLIEAQENMLLLTPEERARGYYVEHDFKGLLKTDTKSRFEAYYRLWQMGYPLNKLLAKDNENPVDGGDKGFIQINMAPVDQVAAGLPDKTKSQRSVMDKRDSNATRRILSIEARDRVSARYYPLILAAAQRVIDFEASSVRNHLEKVRQNRDLAGDVADWLDEFYAGMPERIKRELGPVFRSFSDALMDVVEKELGLDGTNDLSTVVADYIDNYTRRHVESSTGQLMALLRGEIAELEKRVGEWEEKRAEKIAENESVRLGGAVYNTIAFGAGYNVFWRTRGASTCPYCQSLSGRSIGQGRYFVADGDEIEPDNAPNGAMKVYGNRSHPPLHAGCDCFVSIF